MILGEEYDRMLKLVMRMFRCRAGRLDYSGISLRYEHLKRREDITMDLMKALKEQYMKPELPEVHVGDTVRVHVKIKEGSRERVQVFEGTVIAKKHGSIEETITVRRLSYGFGCEKVFPLHSPYIVKVETVSAGIVRRAKLDYLRNRLCKAA